MRRTDIEEDSLSARLNKRIITGTQGQVAPSIGNKIPSTPRTNKNTTNTRQQLRLSGGRENGMHLTMRAVGPSLSEGVQAQAHSAPERYAMTHLCIRHLSRARRADRESKRTNFSEPHVHLPRPSIMTDVVLREGRNRRT